MRLWKVNCMEDKYPGMWQRWFRHQCVGVGWYAGWGFTLDGPTTDRGWSRCRNTLKQIASGDVMLVALHGYRVARVGEVTGMAISDDQWDPLVPPSSDNKDGEIGRRILVRWDLASGPPDRDMVVQLPADCALTMGELRPTLCEVRSRSLDDLLKAMNDPANWVGLSSQFDYEWALRDFIAYHPHTLQDELLPYPNAKVREKVFTDRSRADVLLIDRQEHPVIVECKRAAPSRHDIVQLRHYMDLVKEETGQPSRGILVHGGSVKLSFEVREEAARNPAVEVVRYQLSVDFHTCY